MHFQYISYEAARNHTTCDFGSANAELFREIIPDGFFFIWANMVLLECPSINICKRGGIAFGIGSKNVRDPRRAGLCHRRGNLYRCRNP